MRNEGSIYLRCSLGCPCWQGKYRCNRVLPFMPDSTTELRQSMLLELRLIRCIMQAQLTDEAGTKFAGILDGAPLLREYWLNKASK